MKTKKKKRMSRASIALVIGLIIILIPCAIYGGILIEAIVNTGSPIVGHRFDNDLNPAITENDMANVEAKVSAIENVENVEVVLPTGQLRINVDVADSLSSEEISAIVDTVYNAVLEVLPADVYFTSTDTMRMYDISVNVYNFIKNDSELGEGETAMIYYQLTKNAMMEEANKQLVSEPIDADLVNNMYAEIEKAKQELAEQEAAKQAAENSESNAESEDEGETTE